MEVFILIWLAIGMFSMMLINQNDGKKVSAKLIPMYIAGSLGGLVTFIIWVLKWKL